ncbi:MAG: hypothetical protein HQ518_11515 [Rhodopirellula sp.]|nr:hypothetical protein [Rhodopirellula sp.]
MRLDGAIFSIEQRSVGGCIDLAIVFLREHFLAVLKLLACFAVPSVTLTWWLVARNDWTFSSCVMLFALESPLFGAALVASAGHRVFGDRFSTRVGLRLLAGRFFLILFLNLIVRTLTGIGLMIFVFPGYMIATRYGFLAEVLLLERCPARRYETRLNDLMNGTFRDLLGRLIMIVVFFVVSVASLFVLVDMASGTLLGLPILFGRVSGFAYFFEEVATLMTRDPRVATVFVSILWFVYPVTRLAWMFCYFDVRIRKEGWDVELAFRVEAERLEAAL